MTAIERGRYIIGLKPIERLKLLAELAPKERRTLETHWPFWAREAQMPPSGDWTCWLVCAGRGFGKTRLGAEWVRHVAHGNPDARIALVASSLVEARAVMVEGESGIMAVHRTKDRPHFEASLRRLTWPNGAQATLYSAAEPESLRGPQHSHARRTGTEGIRGQRGVGATRFAAPHGD